MRGPAEGPDAAADVRLDTRRTARLGFDEAILCEHKSAAHLEAVLDALDPAAGGAPATALLTRLPADLHAGLPARHRARIDYCPLSRTGYFGPVAPPAAAARVAVVSAGTSDAAVAREAARTLAYYGEAALSVADVGVAGLWRLLERAPEVTAMPVVIAVAGMDAAMASVLGGLAPGLVVAVPTSTGYGAARGGETAFAASLVSCAPGLVVVNIDNGYGAACAALRALRAFAPRPAP